MKTLTIPLLFLVLTFASCNKSYNSNNLQISKSVSASLSPCDYITKQMIICHFGMSDTKLKFSNSANNGESTQCGFSWEKQNSDLGGINERINFYRKDKNNYIKIGDFKTYEDQYSAVNDFKKKYWITSNNNSSNYKSNNHKNHDAFYKVSDTDIRLTEVFGVGDQAYYDHLNKSLDVRFGTFSFSVFIETSLDTETNILIAKKIAQEVWDNL